MSIKGRIAIVGIGETKWYKRGQAPEAEFKLCIEAIRAAGYPVTYEELDKWYSIPEDVENAAYIIMDAFSYYQDWDKTSGEKLPLLGKEKLPPRTQPLTDETKTLIAHYLSDNQKAVELLN